MRTFYTSNLLSLSLLFLSSSTITNSQGIASSNSSYTTDQCDEWLSAALTSDTDASSGLSEDEFYNLLSSISTPSYIAEYFSTFDTFADLPWIVRVVHKTLACNCVRLGEGEDCCEGEDAEIILDGLDSVEIRNDLQNEYRNFVCQQIGFVAAQIPVPVEEEKDTISSSKVIGDATTNDDDDNNGLSSGAIAGITFVVLVVLAALLAASVIIVHRRKAEENQRLQEFAGGAAKEEDLESGDGSPSQPPREVVGKSIGTGVVEEKEAETVVETKEEGLQLPEAVLAPPQTPIEEKKVDSDNQAENESDDDSSVVSVEDDNVNESILEENAEEEKTTVASTLAAMGVASTLFSPRSGNSPQAKKPFEEDDSRLT
jgi:hypothetical protein